jgi:hypothetical protein
MDISFTLLAAFELTTHFFIPTMNQYEKENGRKHPEQH